ncbi:Protein hook [Bienertia sinuspersici]
MEIPQELDDFIRHSIDDTLGLAIPDQTLQLKVQTLETTNHILRNQYLTLLSKLKQKEHAVELARGEASMNAQRIKKFVEENQRLADECANLNNQCTKLEKECSLYDHDREALMEFGNEADERAKDAEAKVGELEEELKKRTEEMEYYKHQCEMLSVDPPKDGTLAEQKLLYTLVASLVNKDEVVKTASDFLEVNSEVEACRELLNMWNSLRPETQNILSLASHVRTLQNDKEHLRINLHRAEEEVRVLFEENSVLDEENKRLLRLYKSEKKHSSGGKNDSSARAKVRLKRLLYPTPSFNNQSINHVLDGIK